MLVRDTNRYSYASTDDLLGSYSTGLTGATQWTEGAINDTGFIIPFLSNNSGDFFCVRAQSPHWRKQGVNAESIHLHWVNKTAYTANQTVVFDIYYTWVIPNTVIPALAGWQQATSVSLVLSTENLDAWTYGVDSLVTDFAPPSVEGYGVGLLFRVVRGNGTYTGDLGIIWADAHVKKDRQGSLYEYSDTPV